MAQTHELRFKRTDPFQRADRAGRWPTRMSCGSTAPTRRFQRADRAGRWPTRMSCGSTAPTRRFQRADRAGRWPTRMSCRFQRADRAGRWPRRMSCGSTVAHEAKSCLRSITLRGTVAGATRAETPGGFPCLPCIDERRWPSYRPGIHGFRPVNARNDVSPTYRRGLPRASAARGLPPASAARGLPPGGCRPGLPRASAARGCRRGLPRASAAGGCRPGLPRASAARGMPHGASRQDLSLERDLAFHEDKPRSDLVEICGSQEFVVRHGGQDHDIGERSRDEPAAERVADGLPRPHR
jgi:hypothetical protein